MDIKSPVALVESISKNVNAFFTFSEEDDLMDNEHDLYVPVRGTSVKFPTPSSPSFDLNKKVDEFLQGRKKVLLIQGGSGTGKTMFCQNLAMQLSRNWREDQAYWLPIYISLPGVKDPENALIQNGMEAYKINILELQNFNQNHPLLFILDAYDEVNLLSNLYVTNKLGDWKNIKIIYTCRNSYLISAAHYTRLFVPFRGSNALEKLLEEVHVMNFDPAQVNLYINTYLTVKKTQLTEAVEDLELEEEWLNAETYLHHIKSLPNLENLITTPFLLRITMDVLPGIVNRYKDVQVKRIKLTQAALYDAFMQQWFQRQADKLMSLNVHPPYDVRKDYWCFSKRLAVEMQNEPKTTTAEYEEGPHIFNADNAHNRWKMFFSNQNSDVVRARKGSPLRKTGLHHYAFLHDSFREYFYSKEMYDAALKHFDSSVAFENFISSSSSSSSDNEEESNAIFSVVPLYRKNYAALTQNWLLTVVCNETNQKYSLLLEGLISQKQKLKYIFINEKTLQLESQDLPASRVPFLLENKRIKSWSMDVNKGQKFYFDTESKVRSAIPIDFPDNWLNEVCKALELPDYRRWKWESHTVNQALLPRIDIMKQKKEKDYSLTENADRKIVKIKLNLSANKDSQLNALNAALEACHHDVVDLNLDDNLLEDKVLFLLTEKLNIWKNLRFLRLSHNHISKEGVKILLENIKKNNTLEYLLLDHNHIAFDQDFAENYLAEKFKGCSLKTLDLSLNYIDKGVLVEKMNAHGDRKIKIFEDKNTLKTKFGEKRVYCKTLFQQDLRLQSKAHIGIVKSCMHPSIDFNFDENTGIVGLFAYKGNGFIGSFAGEHAFLVLEGVSKFGQRYLMMADLYANSENKKITIQINYASPGDFYSRTKNLTSVYKKCAKVTREQLKALQKTLIDFRHAQDMYRYATLPKEGLREHSCLSWAINMLESAGIITANKQVNSLIPSIEVGNKNDCRIS